MQGEPPFGLRKEKALGYRNETLVNDIKTDSQGEARSGMFRIKARADGRCQVADDRFRDAIEAERDSWPAQAVLQDPYDHSQKQSRRRISPAEAEINGDKQRKIQSRGLRKIDGKKSLQDQGKGHGENNRPGPELVHLDVQLTAAKIEGLVHGFSGAPGEETEADGAPAEGVVELGAGESRFSSRGFIVNRTKTSSRRSRFAAGRTRICLNGFPGLISAIVPTGRSRGKIRSMPLVTTRSPEFTLSSLGMYFMTSNGSPVPPTGLCMRESTSIAPTPLSLSVSRRTCEVLG